MATYASLSRYSTNPCDSMKKSCVMFNSHTGAIGGGELWGYQIATVLNKKFDFRLFSPDQDQRFKQYFKQDIFFPRTAFVVNPDLYVHYSTHVLQTPKGKKNILITCFPRKEWDKATVQKFDTIITLSRYSANYIKQMWDRKAKIVHPAIRLGDYKVLPKEDMILCVSRFFREPGGQSKNQLELIRLFKELNCSLKLNMAGAVLTPDDQTYLDECKKEAEGLDVEFYPNVDRETLNNLYGRAKYLWHANGYNRTDPYQVEHFGIIYLEAMASGCIPIGFETGGGKEFIPFTFRKLEELKKITLDLEGQVSNGLPLKLRNIASEYSMEKLERELLKAIDEN